MPGFVAIFCAISSRVERLANIICGAAWRDFHGPDDAAVQMTNIMRWLMPECLMR